MAIITYNSVFGDIMANLSGVPDVVLNFYMNKVTIDLCERAKVWRVNYAPVSIIPGTYVNGVQTVIGQTDYAIASPVANTELSAILLAKVYYTTANMYEPLSIVTTEQVFEVAPDWPSITGSGQPTAITRKDETSISIVPAPDKGDTYTLYMYCAIKPTIGSSTIESTIYSTYRRAIYHGVLHELMMMPKKPWTDPERAKYHGAQWEFMVNTARARANKSFGRANISVVPMPWA
jgi:hypothetical protein